MGVNEQTNNFCKSLQDYELEKSDGILVEQIIRPTGLLDPKIEIRDSLNQMDDLLEEIRLRVNKKRKSFSYYSY